MGRLYRLLPALILLTLVSCGDSAIFLAPLEEPAEVRVETIDAGVILAPGFAVPIRVVRDAVFTGDPESADRLIVELLDIDGVLLGEQIYESVDQADELPPLLLPDLGEGLYILRTSYLDGDEVIATEDVPFFISNGQFALLGLSSFPATLYPGSAGLLSLSLDVPFGSDPFLEWYLDDRLIQAGFLAETGITLEIQAPGESGAYTVRVDLFPTTPVVHEESVPAVVTYQAELLVSTELLLDQSDLTPERSYFVLHHFLGDLRDSGARTELFESVSSGTRAIGDPTLAVESDIFGYRLDGDDGFELDGFILPVRDGRLTPFSLSFRLRPDDLSDHAHLVDIESGDRPLLRLDIDTDGKLVLDLEDGAVQVVSDEGTVEAGVPSDITVTILPVEEMTIVQFYVDGEAVLTETVEWNAGTLVLPDPLAVAEDGWMALPGSARIAGEGGLVGIIDEFGVYFRDEGDRPSADTEIFLSAMEQVYGEKLVYAEGFEGNDLPEAIQFEGSAQVETGRLILSSGAAALFSVFGFSSEELFVTVSLEALPGSRLRFYRGESDDLIAEHVVSDGETETLDQSTDLIFQFIHSDSVLMVDGPTAEGVQIDLDSGMDFTGLRLEVTQVGDDPAEIAVESVVAWRENPEIPAALFEPQPASEAAVGEATEADAAVEEPVTDP
jgi:hypothetical protein